MLRCAYGYIPPCKAHPDGAHLVRGELVRQEELGARLAESAERWRREMQVEEIPQAFDSPQIDAVAKPSEAVAAEVHGDSVRSNVDAE